MVLGIRAYVEREVGDLTKIEEVLSQEDMTAIQAYDLVRRIEKYMLKVEQASNN